MEKNNEKMGKIGAGDKTHQFRIKTKGLVITFNDLDKAQKEFDKLKEKKLKDEESFFLVLEERENLKSEWKELDSVRISETYYQ